MAAENGNGMRNDELAMDLMNDDYLKCPICQDDLRAPKILPCLHSFCFECLKNSLQQSKIANGQAFLCPLCKEQCSVPFKGVAAMKTNIFYVTLQEYIDRKSQDRVQVCEGCDTGARAKRKCIECNDWLCSQCCSMHKKVRMTRDHTLVSQSDLQNGRYDQVIKDSFEPLLCSKHGEPLRLFCTGPTCQAPICTVCKTTTGHENHVAIELEEQASRDAKEINVMLANLQRNISTTTTKINNLKLEEKVTSQVRKKLHKNINTRMEEIMELFVKELGAYTESLHQEVETVVKNHKENVTKELDESRANLDGMSTAQMFAKSLLEFGRAEELVSMSKDVKDRMVKYQSPPNIVPPDWRQPRLHPPDTIETKELARLFGTMTFEGEVVRCVLVKSFTAQIEGDDKVCAICDLSFTRDHELVLVDRDNRKVKVYDSHGRFKFAIGDRVLKSPNRVTAFRDSNRILVKDDKFLKLLERDGTFVCNFASNLRQPVGVSQNANGEVLIADWMSGSVHAFTEESKYLRQFPCASEGPGYVCSTQGGNVVVTDWKQHDIKVFSKEGTLLHQYGELGSGPNQMNHPYGVCADKYGHFIVADTWNNRIHLFTENGHFVRTLLTKEDGLQWPQAVGVNREGHLVVVEQHGNVKIFQYMA